MMTIQKCRKYQLNCGDTFVLHHSNRIWFDSPFFPSHSWLDIKKYNIFVRHTLIQYGFTIRICIECACKTFEWGILELPSETDTTKKRQRRNSTKQAENFVLRIRNWRRSEKSFLVCYTFAFHFRFVINLHFMHHFCHWNERVNFTHRIYMCVQFAPFSFSSQTLLLLYYARCHLKCAHIFLMTLTLC